MNQSKAFFFGLMFVLMGMLTGCHHHDEPEPTPDPQLATRTVLVYMVADNSMSAFDTDDIKEMKEGFGMAGVDPARHNLLVYVDDYSNNPTLYRITQDATGLVTDEIVYEYPADHDSSSPSVIKDVILRAKAECPAQSYGFVYWSHGEGWIPYPVPTKSVTPMAGIELKWIGIDTTRTNILELGATLKAGFGQKLSFLLLDACYMLSVETLYDLRDAADWVISSPTEIPGPGAPYNVLVPEMLYNSNSTYSVYVDDVVLDVLPTCPKPQGLTAGNSTANSIDLSWTETGSATAWVVEYGPAGFVLGTGTTLNVTGTPSTTVSGLNSSSTYDFYVQADCSGGDVSSWSVKAIGSTLCEAITQLPYTENFDANSWNALPGATAVALMPNCWERINTFSSPRPFCYQHSTYNYNSTPMLYFYSTAGTYNIAVMPEVDASIPVNTLKVSFMYRGFSSSYTTPLSVGVMTDPTDASTYMEVTTVPFDATITNWVSREVSFANYTGKPCSKRFLAARGLISAVTLTTPAILPAFGWAPDIPPRPAVTKRRPCILSLVPSIPLFFSCFRAAFITVIVVP